MFFNCILCDKLSVATSDAIRLIYDVRADLEGGR